MSIGNLKDTGNQGNNLPYQWKVLQGLQAIYDEVSQPLTCVDQVTVCGTTFTGGSLNTHVTNGTGASAVNIQDGGNSITVDALNLDIRDLTHLIDTIKIYGSNNANPVFTDIAGNIGITDNNGSITVDGGTGILRTTGILRPIGGPASNVNVVAPGGFYSVSVANVGSSNGSILGGVANIKPGEVLNFSADAINNYFNSFAYDATGTEFIIIYVA